MQVTEGLNDLIHPSSNNLVWASPVPKRPRLPTSAADCHSSHATTCLSITNDSMAFKLNGDSIANSILVSEEKYSAALLANGHTSHSRNVTLLDHRKCHHTVVGRLTTDGTCESRALLASLPPSTTAVRRSRFFPRTERGGNM